MAYWRPLLLCCLAAAWAAGVAGQCASVSVQRCPTALAAAQLLTGNSSFMPISSATITGTCDATKTQWAIANSFPACHYLGVSMAAGELPSAVQHMPGACTQQQQQASCEALVQPCGSTLVQLLPRWHCWCLLSAAAGTL